MFYILIQLSMIPILCGVYLLAKNKMRAMKRLKPVRISQDIHMILLIAYCLLFILSGGFTGLSVHGPEGIWINRYDRTEWFPVEMIKEHLRLTQFYKHVNPDFNSENISWRIGEILALIKDFGKVFLAYMPIALSIVIMHKRFITGLGIAVVLESFLYIQTGRSFIGVAIIASVVSFAIMFFLNRLVLDRFSLKSLKTKALAIAMLLMCLLLVGHLDTERFYGMRPIETKYNTSDLILSDQGLILQKPEITGYENFIRIAGYLEDHVPFELPYEIERKEYKLNYKCGELELATAVSPESRFDVHLNVYDPRDPFISNAPKLKLELYPLEIEGISQITYKIEDSKLLDQLEVIDENWTEIVPYPIYEVTYRVPKIEGYTASWHRIQSLNLKSGIIKEGRNTAYPSYWDEVDIVDEGSTMKITVLYAYYGIDFDEIKSAVFTVEDVELVKVLDEIATEPVFTIEDKSYFD